MTDPVRHQPERDPEREPERPEAGEPQGLVEEIKEGIHHVKEEIQEKVEHVTEGIQEKIEHVTEEIGHAVEHVPKPVRWTVSRLFWAAMLGLGGLLLLLVLTAILYVANRTEWAAREFTVLLNQTLASRSDIEFEIRDIKGNPFTGVRLLDTSVRFRDGDLPALLSAQTIRVHYSALGLVRGRGPITLELDQPVVRLARGPDGKLRLPRWKPESNPGPLRPTHGWDVRIRVAKGSLRVPRGYEGIEDCSLDARIETGAHTRATLERMSWARGPFGSELFALRGEIAQGDSVRCLVRELRTGDLELKGRAAWAPQAKEYQVGLEVERVRWAWLARVFKNGVLDVPGEGHFVAHAVGGERWRGDFNGSFDWSGLPIEGNGRFEGGRDGWTVEPLSAKSPAGNLEGSFAYDAKQWTVEGDVQHAQPARWDALRLKGWPAGDLNGWFRYMVAAHGPDDLAARLDASQLAGWRADSAKVTMTFPEGKPDTFRVDMVRRGGTMMLLGITADQGWTGRYQVAGMPLDEWPDGRASGIRGLAVRGEGTVDARFGELKVGGTLEGQGTDWFGARVEHWWLEQMSGRLLPTPDLEFRAALSNVTFLGVHFDSAASVARLGDRSLAIGSLEGWAGDTLFTAAGNAAWTADHWSLSFDRAAARSSQFDWTADPPVRLTGDAKGVSFERLTAHDGAARLDFTGRWAAPGGEYSFRAHGDRLQLGRLGLPREWALEGESDASLVVDGASGQPRWTFDASARAPGTRGHRAESAALALSGAPAELDVRTLNLKVAFGSLEASGRVERCARNWPDTLTADGVLRWIEDAGQWQGKLRATSFPLDRVQGLFPQARDWGGRLDATVNLGGSPGDPRFDVNAEARPFAWRDYHVDNARVRGSFHDGHLAVQQLEVSRGGVQSSASGEMPLGLRLGANPELPDEPMSWHVDAPSGDLAVLPLFVPQIGTASGHFDMSGEVGGTARHPQLKGGAHVTGGVLRLAGREEELRELSAVFHLDPGGIHLDSLSARQGDRGQMTGHGDVKLKGLALDGYRFDLSLQDFTAVETGIYAAEFDGNFVVTNGPSVRGQVLPQVTGNAELRHAVVLVDFANQSESEQLAATTQQLYWTYRVQVSATNNLHWQPPDGDIEFSADLTAEQTRDSLIVYGDMTSLRGTYYFLSNRFNVTRANLTFDNLSGVNPTLDVEAVTNIRQPVSASNNNGACSSKGVEVITATITGRANEPVVALTSYDQGDSGAPPWDQSCILQQLTIGRFATAQGSSPLEDPLDSYLTQAINRTLSAEMSRTFKGYINEWVLERERGGLLSGEGDVIVGVGIPVNRNIQVRYRQRVPGLEREYGGAGKPEDPFERDVEAEYRLNRFFYITTELKQRRILTGSTGSVVGTPDFNVNLKARWEY